MTAIEAYKKFLLKINKNDTNSDVDISKGEFVLLYNEQKDKWLSEKISQKESELGIQDLAELQVKHKELEFSMSGAGYVYFFLPKDYFSYISSYSHCSDETCKGVIVRHFPIKPKNENMLLENANTEPSLEFEETVVDLSGNSIIVYTKDFIVDRTLLNYYREVGKIDLAGYRKLDGNLSSDVHPDISDNSVDEILNRCAKEVIRRYENPEGFQLAHERILTEK
jgi:hypothetical protein